MLNETSTIQDYFFILSRRNVEVMSKDHEVSHKHQPEVVKDVYHAEPVIPENASIDKSDTVHGEGGDVKVLLLLS